MAGFFPVFFKTFWSAGAASTLTTARLGLANAAAGMLLALCAPLLGAVADCRCAKKKFLLAFTAVGTAATAALFFTGSGHWAQAAALFVAGTIGFSGAVVFYDALLPSVASDSFVDRVSSLGFALGYLGGGLLFAACVLLTLYPESAPLLTGGTRTGAVRVSFLLTAAWWSVFTVPVMLLVREPAPGTGAVQPIRNGMRQLAETVRSVLRSRNVRLFLLAYWFYIDGVDTIIRMAVDYGMSLGFSANDLMAALLITQVVGFPCALLFGRLGQRWGTRRALYLAIACYCGIVLWGMTMRSREEFYVLAGLVGMAQGGIQALSRSCFARMVPPGKEAQYFGLYNMVGKYAAVLGPALMGVTAHMTGSPRIGIASILVFFIIGGALLKRSSREASPPAAAQ